LGISKETKKQKDEFYSRLVGTSELYYCDQTFFFWW